MDNITNITCSLYSNSLKRMVFLMWRKYISGSNYQDYLKYFFDSMCEAFALHEIICDDNGKPVDFRFLIVNTAFTQMTGLTKEEVLGKRVTEVFPIMDNSLIERYGKVALSGTPIQFETYFPQLDKYFKICTFSPVNGQFITFFYDITELKKATEFFQKYHILFENAQDIILYTKQDGSIVDANKNATIKYGYSRDELIKMNIKDIRHPSTEPDFTSQMKDSDTHGVIFECIHVSNNGSSFPVEVSAKSSLIGKEIIRIHIIRDITERKAAEDKIKYLANYDALTGIPNRGYLMKKYDNIFHQSKQENSKFALILFDVDKFKKINDVYGHDVGDIVLIDTAKKVQSAIRKSDFLGRLGGDEFIIILPYINNKDDAAFIANRIMDEFKKPVKANGIELPVTISMGIAIFPENSMDKEALMILSDKAMYMSKQSGGNTFKFI
jgi:diguanylate cyclase (GGDEF)-like protein/PAS domain S-box-containing protein